MAASVFPTAAMNYYCTKLLAPRATFPADMTPAEAQLMQAHAAYWRTLMDRGLAVAYGPVMDPRGTHGLGILELPDDADPCALLAEDPIIKAGLGFTAEAHPMPRAVVRPAPPRLTPDEQMALFEKDLKENDWGHQPC